MLSCGSDVPITSAGALLALPPVARAAKDSTVVLYEGPQCGCCGGWEKHIRGRLSSRNACRRRPAGAQALVRRAVEFWTCHTGVIGGYVVEGHVPATAGCFSRGEGARHCRVGDAARLARHGTGAAYRYQHYSTYAFTSRSNWVFERH